MGRLFVTTSKKFNFGFFFGVNCANLEKMVTWLPNEHFLCDLVSPLIQTDVFYGSSSSSILTITSLFFFSAFMF